MYSGSGTCRKKKADYHIYIPRTVVNTPSVLRERKNKQVLCSCTVTIAFLVLLSWNNNEPVYGVFTVGMTFLELAPQDFAHRTTSFAHFPSTVVHGAFCTLALWLSSLHFPWMQILTDFTYESQFGRSSDWGSATRGKIRIWLLQF